MIHFYSRGLRFHSIALIFSSMYTCGTLLKISLGNIVNATCNISFSSAFARNPVKGNKLVFACTFFSGGGSQRCLHRSARNAHKFDELKLILSSHWIENFFFCLKSYKLELIIVGASISADDCKFGIRIC